jgi:murein DD-endopeptidase MepM/ murein hydrolase activator NlpD
MPRARTCLAVALLLLAAASAASAADPELRGGAFQSCRKRVDAETRRIHLALLDEHRDIFCERFAEKIENRLPEKDAWRWVLDRLRDVEFAWAPLGAHQKPGTAYRLPYLQWIPRLCSQASGGETHNTPEHYYAFDFLMPIGTQVLAARDGVVAQVNDGTPEGVPWQQDDGNSVYVLHRDGTFALYHHLSAGVPVRVGQLVASGQPIALSGNTGFSRTPHLHFVVQARTREGELRAIPIRFSMPGRASFDLEASHHHGVVPPSKRTLRILLDGKLVDGEQPIPFRYGAEASLRLELVAPDGTVSDVTRHERTRYETMTVWNVWVPEPGRIKAAVVPGVDDVYIKRTMPLLNQSEGLLFVYHGIPKDPDFGFARLTLAIEVPEKPAAKP